MNIYKLHRTNRNDSAHQYSSMHDIGQRPLELSSLRLLVYADSCIDIAVSGRGYQGLQIGGIPRRYTIHNPDFAACCTTRGAIEHRSMIKLGHMRC